MKRRKIIGAKVRLRFQQMTRMGEIFAKGTIMQVYSSHRGLSLKDENGRCICRVNKNDVEFIEDEK